MTIFKLRDEEHEIKVPMEVLDRLVTDITSMIPGTAFERTKKVSDFKLHQIAVIIDNCGDFKILGVMITPDDKPAPLTTFTQMVLEISTNDNGQWFAERGIR